LPAAPPAAPPGAPLAVRPLAADAGGGEPGAFSQPLPSAQ
jgi:hypothetical protein